MTVVTSAPVVQYHQSNGTLTKTGGSSRKYIVEEGDSGEDEEIEETETIIKKTIIRKKGKRKYVRRLSRETFALGSSKCICKLFHCLERNSFRVEVACEGGAEKVFPRTTYRWHSLQ